MRCNGKSDFKFLKPEDTISCNIGLLGGVKENESENEKKRKKVAHHSCTSCKICKKSSYRYLHVKKEDHLLLAQSISPDVLLNDCICPACNVRLTRLKSYDHVRKENDSEQKEAVCYAFTDDDECSGDLICSGYDSVTVSSFISGVSSSSNISNVNLCRHHYMYIYKLFKDSKCVLCGISAQNIKYSKFSIQSDREKCNLLSSILKDHFKCETFIQFDSKFCNTCYQKARFSLLKEKNVTSLASIRDSVLDDVLSNHLISGAQVISTIEHEAFTQILNYIVFSFRSKLFVYIDKIYNMYVNDLHQKNLDKKLVKSKKDFTHSIETIFSDTLLKYPNASNVLFYHWAGNDFTEVSCTAIANLLTEKNILIAKNINLEQTSKETSNN